MMDTVFHLFKNHVGIRQQSAEGVLRALNYDVLLFHSGVSTMYFADDQEVSFRTNPHFASWLPLEGPFHILLVREGVKPLLISTTPSGYWHEQIPLGNPFWKEYFECYETQSEEDAWREVEKRISTMRVAYIGPKKSFKSRGIEETEVNPPSVISELDWGRSFKTTYEIACIEEANRVASVGHLAARDIFFSGGSELVIHQAYMRAVACTEKELPYETIVALDQKGATLHYGGKRSVGSGRVLLLDAGARYLGYCSDITRTWVRQDVDPVFHALVRGVDALQQELVVGTTLGLSFSDFHRNAEVKIADLLFSLNIIKRGGEEAVELGLTKVFFPHGVGHFLGIQVHDVGGKQRSASGEKCITENGSALRTLRTIEESHVFTVEPGVYFIPMLLLPQRTGESAKNFNWELIDRLTPFGGVRVEDNVVALKNGVRNLTREFLS